MIRVARRPAPPVLQRLLDDGARDVLAHRLADLNGVVIFASHDRVFLDDIATELIDLDPAALGTDGVGGRRFGGGWSDYESARAAARARWEPQYAAEQEEIERLRVAAAIGTAAIAHDRGPRDNDKFIYQCKGAGVERTLARRKKDAERRLADAEQRQTPKPPPLRFRASLTTRSMPGPLIAGSGLWVSDRLALPALTVASGEHLLITGPNGAGKSSLLGVIAGRVSLDAGDRHLGGNHHRRFARPMVAQEMGRSGALDHPSPCQSRRLNSVPIYRQRPGESFRSPDRFRFMCSSMCYRPRGDMNLEAFRRGRHWPRGRETRARTHFRGLARERG